MAGIASDVANTAPKLIPVTISKGQNLSSSAALGGLKPIGFAMPAEFDTATLSFQCGFDGVTFFDVSDVERPNVSAALMFVIGPHWFGKAQFLKVRSSVAQTADRIIQTIATSYGTTIMI
ncbi:hypothetical protein [Bradyrhizobium sp. USDA 4520]